MKYLILLFVFFLTETVFASSYYEDYMENLEDSIEDTNDQCKDLIAEYRQSISAATSEFNSSNLESIDDLESIAFSIEDDIEDTLHDLDDILEDFSYDVEVFRFPIIPLPGPSSFTTRSIARRDVEMAIYPDRRDRRVNQVLKQKRSIFKEIHSGLNSCTNYQFTFPAAMYRLTFPAISIENESEKLRWQSWQRLVENLTEDVEEELMDILGDFWGSVSSSRINEQRWIERESYIFGLINTEEEVSTYVRPPCSVFPRTLRTPRRSCSSY